MGIYGSYVHRLMESKIKRELEKEEYENKKKREEIEQDLADRLDPLDKYRNEKGVVPIPKNLPKREK